MVSEIFGHIIRIVWCRFNDNIPPKNVDKHKKLLLLSNHDDMSTSGSPRSLQASTRQMVSPGVFPTFLETNNSEKKIKNYRKTILFH